MTGTRPRPFAVDSEEYPFTDCWLERGGTSLHYIDEGEGTPVLFLHGNPTWSYLYRNVIRSLRDDCRCIAPDYPGFGYSPPPPDYGFSPQEHAESVAALVEELKLERSILVAHDWGGPIGLSVAVERPESLAGLVLLNTWCWKPDFRFRLFSLVMGNRPLKPLHLRWNTFVRLVLPAGIATPDRRTSEALKPYRDAFPTPASRMGTWVFPRAIRTESAWLESVEQRLASLRDTPVEIVWGLRDPAFGRKAMIDRWLHHFPDARVERLNDASHYVPEDRPERVTAAVRRLLERTGN